MAGVILVQDDEAQSEPAPRTLTTQTVAGPPQQLQVSDDAGLLATLTVGARTVTVRGQTRTFTERKRPFTDNFSRTRTGGFGTSAGGGNWVHLSGTDAQFTCDGTYGRILVEVADDSRWATLVDNVTDVNVTTKFTVDELPTGNACSLAIGLAYTDSSNQYRARLAFLTSGSVQLTMEKSVAGAVTNIGALTTVGTGFTPGQVWNIRAERTGTTIRCRAWKEGDPEPTTWLHSTTDTSLTSGRVGLRGFATAGNTNVPLTFLVDSFTVTSASWPTDPSVTHNTWVRLLTAPFTGTWTSDLADTVRRWAVDCTPDVLAYAMMYVTGAPTVTSPALSGAQIAGQASYGPLDTAGVPTEGADFHDYMGRSWTFPNGESATAGAGQSGCLDCSGFVRMVYGYHMGLPMVRTSGIDGTVLPRMTKDIGPSGPGIIVAQSSSTAPALTAMQIGDVPHFDADTTDPVTGQLDHNGIYLGTDSAGAPRFINSRKTPNGPTMADLGGASTLTGGGTYATSLRLIRRF
ncbi:hypothetical protein [Streptomyces longwoodensis]|uniref:hypothetical protein n=1 Tax=Streptomyces longwoodensis TaxID=68231 RepID=UPI0034022A38